MLIRLSNAILVMMLLWGTSHLSAAELRVEASVVKNAITAVATNELGHPAAGAVISFQLPSQGPSGLFANGLRSEITVAGADGKATISGIRWDDGTAPITIRVTASKDGARAATITEWRAAPPLPATPVASAVPSPAISSKASVEKVVTPEPDTAIPVYRGGSGWGRKLLWAGLVVGGIAAGGLIAQSRRSSAGTTGTPPGAIVTAPVSLSVGAPIITIGKP